jgi:DNA polymerase I
MVEDRALWIDGFSLIYRAYYAVHAVDAQGHAIGALLGFTKSVQALYRLVQPTRIAVAFDEKRPTFRHQLYADYKAKRKPMPEELQQQLPWIRAWLAHCNIPYISCAGFEADDVLGTLAHLSSEVACHAYIASLDKDFIQLINPQVTLIQDRLLVDEAAVIKRYGVKPIQWIDYLMLLGDASDNVPGVVGVGPKTAQSWLSTYGTLSNVLSRTPLPARHAAALTAYMPHRERARQLLTIITHCPITLPCSITPNFEQGKHYLQSFQKPTVAASTVLELVNFVWLDDHNTLYTDCTDSATGYVGFDVKRLWHHDANWFAKEAWLDIKLVHWLLTPWKDHQWHSVCLEYGLPSNDKTTLPTLYNLLYTRLTASQKEWLTRVEQPVQRCLWLMEKRGVLIDTQALQRYAITLAQKIEACTQQAYDYAGEPFLLSSPKQVSAIFLKLNILTHQKTDEATLRQLQHLHPIVTCLLMHRRLSKLKNTYADPLIEHAAKTGRLHTTFQQTGTITGRLASQHPNLQNIPIKTSEGKTIRGRLIASDGYHLVWIDYRHMELCALAHLSRDEALCAALHDHHDLHTAVAAQLFNITLTSVTETQRRLAKTLQFGILYGLSPFGLSRQLDVSLDDAKHYIQKYFEQYPGVTHFLETLKTQVKQHRCVTTAMGRTIALSTETMRAHDVRSGINAMIQGTASDVLKCAMLALQNTLNDHQGYLLLNLHDELLFEIPSAQVLSFIASAEPIMTRVVNWQVPLKVQSHYNIRWQPMHPA